MRSRSENEVSTTTRASGSASRMRFVASMPSMTRHRQVHEDDVGRVVVGEHDRLRAVGGRARRPRCRPARSSSCARPARTTAWSSASSTRIIATGTSRQTPRPAPGLGVDVEAAARVLRHVGEHAQAEVAVVARRARASSGVKPAAVVARS